MNRDFLIVGKRVLPDYYEKVIEARRMLSDGSAKDVTDAAAKAGISRSTYYKYKDVVFSPSESEGGRKAVISMKLRHEPGVLGKVLGCLSENGANIYTISQNPPIRSSALVVISIIVDALSCGIGDLIDMLTALPGVEACDLTGMD